MARGSLIASLALHTGVIALVCGAALRERTGGGCEENGAQWIVNVDPADDLVAAEPIESGDVSALAEQAPERRPAKVLPAAISVNIAQTFAPMTTAISSSVVTAPSITALPSFAKESTAGAASAQAKVRSRPTNGGSSASGRTGTPARYAFCPPPPFPSEARKARISGTVVLTVQIDARGRPISIALRRSSGHAVLDIAAERAVRAWRFDPAQRDGQPVDARLEIPVRFALS
ncbi:MAG: TonB family protein [Verrucomicrobiota bacterium]